MTKEEIEQKFLGKFVVYKMAGCLWKINSIDDIWDYSCETSLIPEEILSVNPDLIRLATEEEIAKVIAGRLLE